MQPEQRRGRPMHIEPHPLPAGTFGLWLALGAGDLIFYQDTTTLDHQKAIILHELGHVLAGHASDQADLDATAALMPNLAPTLIRAATIRKRTCYDADDERAAETISTIIYEWADRQVLLAPSPSTGRAAWLNSAFTEPIGWT